ncbi:hypothetical protein TUZN_0118 [Thermoproteus uzoniensis 768-20]|uniref:DUF4258 domain-containing protein n=1 Tax=Thermoproteus uzoniensis (strain 768-20) TaxID=999630 RepID=F2L1F1_THEU7|nr:hypothetical protein TUZN_0118 [Thermoproteus uzoniensis 768-20]
MEFSRHALEKHRLDVAKYAGLELLEAVASNIDAIFRRGEPDVVPDRLIGLELERRRTVVKYRCKTLRVVVAKTQRCYLIVTVFPDPGSAPHFVVEG